MSRIQSPNCTTLYRQQLRIAALLLAAITLLLSSFYGRPSRASNLPPVNAVGEDAALRLPESVHPLSYKILIEPYTEQGRFLGTESIDIVVTKEISQIVLNSVDISVNSAVLQVGGHEKLKVKVRYLPKLQEIVFELPHKIKSGVDNGRCTLSFNFAGVMSDKYRGFFRSRFDEPKCGKQWLAATQMEPTGARRMFPCFDEPALKATFKITASVDPSDTVISNSPIANVRIDRKNDRKVVTFEETPTMSTYLVALVCGHLVGSDTVFSEGVPIRVWCTPGKERLTGYSQALAAKLLTYYRNYFDVPYPAKKLDLIAVPDFGYGAMENLGAATFREDTLLVDAKDGSLEARQQVAINVAHELAHMWFGDLVTMRWWDDLWLNESFAEWMSTKAIDQLQPDWHYWNTFALERDQAMLSDSLKATRPIHGNVSDPDQIEQLFDEITYQKGASVLRMAERYVGDRDFRDGIADYIKSHEFGNATTDDLWASISCRSGKDVAALMHGWIYQEGFPLITVVAHDSAPEVNQHRFVFKANAQEKGQSQQWTIPLEVRKLDAENREQDKLLLSERTASPSQLNRSPFIINAGGEGYYRVKYSPEALRVIASRLSQLTVLERAAVLSDQFYLALAGQIPASRYLDFTEAYKNETDQAVTAVLCSQFKQLDLMVDESARADFAELVRDRLSMAQSSCDRSRGTMSEIARRQQSEILLTMGTIGEDARSIARARSLARQLFAHPETCRIDPELLNPILKIVAYNGGDSDYSQIKQLWHNAKSPERQESALMALALFRNPELMNKTLKMCLTDEVPRQDGTQLIAAIMETRAGRVVAWEFFRKHILHIAWRFSGDRLYNVVMAMNVFATEKQFNEVKAFFTKHPVPSQSRGISKIFEAIEVRLAFKQKNAHAFNTRVVASSGPNPVLASEQQSNDETIHISQK